MKGNLTDKTDGTAIIIDPCSSDGLENWLKAQDVPIRNWVSGNGFDASAGSICLIPDAEGRPARVLLGVTETSDHWDFGALAGSLPKGRYQISEEAPAELAAAVALGWGLGAYRFDRYKKMEWCRAPLTLPAQ
ncbi:MAG: leucyl aminopeptidase family protein, partial [Proteobacteria bacterium]|nr:leucyl aminopeptidase family protein [Pseudomonadota bacterium]